MLLNICILTAILTIPAVICAITWYRGKLSLLNLTDETNGVITSIKKQKFYAQESGQQMFRYKIKIAYSADDREYTTAMVLRATDISFHEGQAVIVLYDKNAPKRSLPKDYKEPKKEWKMYLWCVLFLCVIAWVCIGIVSISQLSDETSYILRAVFEAMCFILCLLYLSLFRRTNKFKKESEIDPKSTRATVFLMWGILIESGLSLILRIAEKL